jgi:hypothetical protein
MALEPSFRHESLVSGEYGHGPRQPGGEPFTWIASVADADEKAAAIHLGNVKKLSARWPSLPRPLRCPPPAECGGILN